MLVGLSLRLGCMPHQEAHAQALSTTQPMTVTVPHANSAQPHTPTLTKLASHPLQGGLTLVHATLSNGHQIFVIQRPGVPVMTLDTWVATGSKHEIPENNGVSHFLEHLLFKGTESFAPRVIDNDWANKGITFNAATSKDFTHYYQVMPSVHFTTVCKQHAEMLLKARIPVEELDAERKVVQQEISRALDNPMAQLFNALYEQQFPKHPYALTTLGPASLIGTIPRERIMAYYHQWYHPQNFYTVAVGDLPPQEVIQHILQGFYGEEVTSRVQRPLPEAQKDPHFNPQLSPQRVKLLPLPSLTTSTGIIALQGPSYKTPLRERLALELALSILSTPKTGKLHRDFVDKRRLADSFSTGVDLSRDASLLYAYFKTPQTQAFEAIIPALNTHMTSILKEGFTKEEVTRAVQQAIKTHAFSHESSEAMANTLGQILSTGGALTDYTEYLNTLKTLTPHDLTQALNTWWHPEKASFTAIIPANTSEPVMLQSRLTTLLTNQANPLTETPALETSWHPETPRSEAPLLAATTFSPTNTQSPESPAKTLQTLSDKQTAPSKTPSTQAQLNLYTLPYGATDTPNASPLQTKSRGKLIIKQISGLETVYLKLSFKPNPHQQTLWTQTSGQRQLLSQTLTEATHQHSPEALQAWMQSEGLNVAVSADDDALTLTLSSVKESLPELLKLGEALMRRPLFPQDALHREWQQLRTGLMAVGERPSSQLFDTFTETFYTAESPYGQSAKRLLEQLKTTPSQKDLTHYWHMLRTHSPVTAVAIGDLSVAEHVSLQRHMSQWITPQTMPKARKVIVSLRSKKQAQQVPCPPLGSGTHSTLTTSQEVIVSRDKQADTWVLQARAVPGLEVLKKGKMDAEVRFALAVRVLNAILGDGMNSRYFVELREKQGLAYEVGGFQELHNAQGTWVSYIGTTPEHEATVKEGFQKELQRIAEGDFTDKVLEDAKQKLMGSFIVRHESPEAQASYLGLYEMAGVGAGFDTLYPEWLTTVTREELQQAAQTLTKAPMLTVVVRPKPSKASL